MNKERMPGFTADASVYNTSAHYITTGLRANTSDRAEVLLQQTTSLRLPEGMLRMQRVCVEPAYDSVRDPSCYRMFQQCVSMCLYDDPWKSDWLCQLECDGECPSTIRVVGCGRWEWRPAVCAEYETVWERSTHCLPQYNLCISNCGGDQDCEGACDRACPELPYRKCVR